MAQKNQKMADPDSENLQHLQNPGHLLLTVPSNYVKIYYLHNIQAYTVNVILCSWTVTNNNNSDILLVNTTRLITTTFYHHFDYNNIVLTFLSLISSLFSQCQGEIEIVFFITNLDSFDTATQPPKSTGMCYTLSGNQNQ